MTQQPVWRPAGRTPLPWLFFYLAVSLAVSLTATGVLIGLGLSLIGH